MKFRSALQSVWGFIRKPTVSFLLRVFISGLLLAYLINLSAFDEIAQVVRNVNPLYLSGFFLLYYFSVGLQSIRWKILLNAWDHDQRTRRLFRHLMIGLFLNNFLPGSLGGDAYRLYAGTRDSGRVESVAATIFYERVLSYASLVTLGLGVLSIRFNFTVDRVFWVILGGVFMTLVCILAFSSLPAFGRWMENLVMRFAIAEKFHLKNWIHGFRFKVKHPGRLIVVFLLSFLIQFSDILGFRLIASAIQLPVRLIDLILFVPLLYLAILLPLSVNGIGIREGIFVFFSSLWGISSADAIAFSLTVFTLNLTGSLIGGLFYWFDRPAGEQDITKYGVSG